MSHSCREYTELSRRRFLVGSVAAATAVASPAWLPRVAMAQGFSSRDVLIHIYLRGGVDALTLAVPYAEPLYYALRPTVDIPQPDSSSTRKAIDLDGFFGLPPSLAALVEPYRARQLAIVHAVGAPNWSRSHFDAQRLMEAGLSSQTPVSGWLGRHLRTTSPAKFGSQLRGVSLTRGLRRTLVGGPQSLAIRVLADFGDSGGWENQAELSSYIQDSYSLMSEPLRSIAGDTQKTIELLKRIDFVSYRPAGGAVYPAHDFAVALRSTAALIKADLGVEAIHLDLDGFDTHSNQGSKDGYLDKLLTVLGDSLGAFWKDMSGSNRKDWTSVVVSEFGRTARENGSRGTDHGTAGAMILMGPNVKGRRVYTDWPGLRDDQLFQQADLAPTIDFRDILAEVCARRLGNTNLAAAFPNFTPNFRNVVNSSK
ncbi:MAG: DUF1501 domain-containing protein [Fimbriimonas sp.]